MTRLLLATGNSHKLRELKQMLDGLPYEVVSPADVGTCGDVAETGSSFEENATLKATTLAAASGLLTLADDSGLEVEALDGAPGIYSARYAGEDASDADRVAYLLKKLEGVPPSQRQARFRCVIAIATPQGKTELFEGECRGFITLEPCGQHGFGYDPVFFVPEYNMTMAELPPETKNRISHRARAIARAVEYLKTRQR
jgi:XTP/dITP diphosphohydrolase